MDYLNALIRSKDSLLTKPLREFKESCIAKIDQYRSRHQAVPLDLFIFEFLVVKHKVIPNFLTLCRIAMAWPLYLNLVEYNNDTAFFIFTTAICTDFIDGIVAHGFDNVTWFGKIVDPIADKIITAVVLIGMKNDVPDWVFYSILSIAGTLFLISAAYFIGRALFGITSTFGASGWGKWKFAFECGGYVLLFGARFLIPSLTHQTVYYLGILFLIISIPLGIMSIVGYLWPMALKKRFGEYRT